MNKIKITLITGSAALLLMQSCQQPKADQATIDAKVTEAYNAEKLKIENEAATACEDAVNAKVKAIQDSMATLSASQQAAALAKAQADLKRAQASIDKEKKKRAQAEAIAKKKEAASAAARKAQDNSKPKGPAKPVLDEKGNQVGTPTTRGDAHEVDKNIKLNEQGNQVGTPTTR